MNEIICIGNTSYDITAYIDGYPEENMKYMSHEFNECGGGPAANASYLIAKWGEKSVLVSLTGNDIYSKSAEEALRKRGVDTTNLFMDPEVESAVSIITVNKLNGSRTLINRNKLDQINNPDNVTFEKYNPAVLLFDGYELDTSERAMEIFPDAESVLDAGSFRSETEILAPKVDHLVCSEKFACTFTGLENLQSDNNYRKAFSMLEKLCPNNIVITIGEKGMIYKKDNEIIIMPSFEVKAVDTTGAGDIFHGAYAYGLLKKMSLEDNLRFSSAAAALSACKKGGMTSIPELDEVREFIKSKTMTDLQ